MHDDFHDNVPSNGFTSLLHLLPHEDHGVRESCLRLITKLSAHDDSRGKILEAGLLKVLVAMLRNDGGGIRKVSLKGIADLVKYEDFRDILLEYNFITPMRGILRESNWVEHSALLCAVVELAKYEDSRGILLESLPVPLLASLRRFLAGAVPKDSVPNLSSQFLVAVEELNRHDDSGEKMREAGLTDSMLDSLRERSALDGASQGGSLSDASLQSC